MFVADTLTSCHRPLLALVPAFILGLIAGAAWPGHRGPALLVCVAGLLWALVCLCQRRKTRLSPPTLWLACGYLAIQPWLAPYLPENDITNFADGSVRAVTAEVTQRPQRMGRRFRTRVRVLTLSPAKNEQWRAVRGNLRLTWAADQGTLRHGDRIRFNGRLRRLRSFHNPGGFDYARYMAFRGLQVSAYARQGTLRVLVAADPPGRWSAFARRRLSEAAAAVAEAGAACPRPAVGPLMEALLLGRRQGLTAEMREPYNRCGVAHLLAISGLHLGAVGGAAFAFFGVLFVFVPALRWRGWVQRTAALFALVPVLAYAILAGLPVSTQRAAVMLIVFMAAILIQRQSDPFNTLALAALVVLAVHPPALFSISFQLSFCAVSAILYGVTCSGEWWRRGPPGLLRLRHRLRLLALVSALAFLGTAPLVAHYFNTLSMVALPVNLLVVPWVSFLVLPAGLAGLLLALGSLPGADLLLTWCAHHLGAVDLIVGRLAGLPWAAVDTVTPSILELVIGYGLLTLLPWFSRSPKMRWATLLLVLLLGADAAYWTHQRYMAPGLRVTAIDVGQGGSSLVELPGGKTLLIDGGGFSDNRVFDVGRRVLTPLLGRRKIRTIDLVILSHPNSDHLNGLLYLLKHFHVGQFWRNADAPDTVGFAELRRRLAQEEIPNPPFEALPRRLRLGAVKLELLHPPRHYAPQRTGGGRRTNDNSLVVKLTYGMHRFLWPGDLERSAEAQLADGQSAASLAATVLFAPHHGSRSSNSPEWVAAVAPKEVVCSVGWQNPYHFPHPVVVERYRQAGARLWRTDLRGAVTFISDGRHLTVRPTLPGAAGASPGS
jgi:competence protein ComEC